MNEIIEAVNRAAADAESRAAAAADSAALEALRIEYLGRNGLFPELSKKMGTIPPEERKATGGAFNQGRTRIQQALDAAAARLGGGKAAKDAIDLTLPGRWWSLGAKHPLSRVIEESAA